MEQTAPHQELILQPNAALLARPVTIISESVALIMAGDIKQALSVNVETPEDFKAAASLLNAMGKLGKSVKEKALDLGRPFRDESAAISTKAEEALKPYRDAASHVSASMTAYDKKVEAENAEKLRKAREAAERNIKKGNLDKAEEIMVNVSPTIQDAPTAKGVKPKETAVILSFDLAKLPMAYHLLDEAKVKKAILAGIITVETPGIVFKVEKSFSGTGR